MESGRRCEDWLRGRSQTAVGHKKWVSRARRVVGEPGAVSRPVELGHPFQVWSWFTAQCRYCPDADVAATALFCLRTQKVTREPSGENPRVRIDGFTRPEAVPRVRLWN